jgi:3-oxoacyl-[acyl-carrier-protein] synthase-1
MNGACYVQEVAVVSALGSGVEATRRRLLAGDRSGMLLEGGWLPEGVARVGKIDTVLPAWPAPWPEFDCRNNRLFLAALEQIRPVCETALAKHGPARVGIVLGTSTSGIASGEDAVEHKRRHGSFPSSFRYEQQEIGTLAPAAARVLGIEGPAYTISTACTSGAKALAAARGLLRMDLCDAVIAGGVDTLCRLTVSGFAALESLTEEHCNPMSRHRNGINIGEAAALFLLSRDPAPVALVGVGESSDAHHISAPDPSGRGAEAAIRVALADAGIGADAIGYVNLHATGTQKNDEMESQVMARLFGDRVPMSGTKPLTGHALGAAGALEAAFCWMAMTGDGRLPPHVWDGEADPALPRLHLVGIGEASSAAPRWTMNNNFAFGGNNVSLVFRRD